MLMNINAICNSPSERKSADFKYDVALDIAVVKYGIMMA